jgi:two-component system cell cycle response regulator
MEYLVEIIGFAPADRALFASTFALSARRETRYSEFRAGMSGKPDLYLVDSDDAHAMRALDERAPDVTTPGVLVGAAPAGTRWLVIERPIRWLRLFKALDESLENALNARTRMEATVSDFVKTLTLAELEELERTRGQMQGAGDAPNSDLITTHAGLSAEALASSSAMGVGAPNRAGQVASAQMRARQPADWVLVVDDNLTVRKFIAQKLAPFNINVDFAETGEQAVGLTGTKFYSCVFLDVVMPGIDGYQVCKVIKSKKTQKTAIVMLTSKDSPFDKIRGKMAGCDAYLTKPVDEDRLLETITRFLPGAREPLVGFAQA